MQLPRVRRPLRAAFALSVVLAAGSSGLRAEPDADPEADDQAAYPVIVDGVTLFTVRGRAALPGRERARRLAEQIADLASDPGFDPRSIQVVEGSAGSQIMAGAVRLMVVTQGDAGTERGPREAIATIYREAIVEAIERAHAERTPTALGRALTGTLIIAASLLAFLILLVLVGRWLGAVLEKRLHRRLRHVQIESFKLIDAELIWNTVRGALRTLRVILALGACFVALGLVLHRFPGTRAVAKNLLSYVIDPLRTIGHVALGTLPNLIFLVILVVIVRWLLKAAHLFFESIKSGSVKLGGFDADWAAPTYRLVRVVVLAFALIVAYPYIPGSSSEAFKAVSIFAGILLSLGSTSVISSIIAGYAMTYRRTFRIGDRVKIGTFEGDVEQIGVMVTRVRTIRNEEAVIPNSAILQGEVLNYSAHAREQGLILHVKVGIGYEVPWRQVEGMLLLAADRTPRVRREPRPFVWQRELADFSVNYELCVYCDDARAMLDVYTELHRSVLDVFNEYGVQIMTPAYRGDPAEPKIVPRDQWYAAPARMDPANPPVAGAK